METAPVKGPLGLIPITVTALLDDYRPSVAAVPIPAAMEATVVLTEPGACSAKVVTVTESTISVAADANANAEIFSTGYRRCRNGKSRQGCKRKTKFSHIPSSQ
jgi:hypothetical protein